MAHDISAQGARPSKYGLVSPYPNIGNFCRNQVSISLSLSILDYIYNCTYVLLIEARLNIGKGNGYIFKHKIQIHYDMGMKVNDIAEGETRGYTGIPSTHNHTTTPPAQPKRYCTSTEYNT